MFELHIIYHHRKVYLHRLYCFSFIYTLNRDANAEDYPWEEPCTCGHWRHTL